MPDSVGAGGRGPGASDGEPSFFLMWTAAPSSSRMLQPEQRSETVGRVQPMEIIRGRLPHLPQRPSPRGTDGPLETVTKSSLELPSLTSPSVRLCLVVRSYLRSHLSEVTHLRQRPTVRSVTVTSSVKEGAA